jgi:hypothetical protein
MANGGTLEWFNGGTLEWFNKELFSPVGVSAVTVLL